MTRGMVWALLIVVLAIQISLSVPALAQQTCLARSRRVLKEAWTDEWAEGLLARDNRRSDEVYACDLVLSVLVHIVQDNVAALRPANQDRLLKRHLINDGSNVIGPFVAIHVLVGLQRSTRHAVPAQIEGDDPVPFLCQFLTLLRPA